MLQCTTTQKTTAYNFQYVTENLSQLLGGITCNLSPTQNYIKNTWTLPLTLSSPTYKWTQQHILFHQVQCWVQLNVQFHYDSFFLCEAYCHLLVAIWIIWSLHGNSHVHLYAGLQSDASLNLCYALTYDN